MNRWIETSSSADFLKNFNKLEGQYSGITIGEYLEVCSVVENEYEFRNVMTSIDFIFGLEDEPMSIKIGDSSEFTSNEMIKSIEVEELKLGDQYSDLFEAQNDSPYFDEALAA